MKLNRLVFILIATEQKNRVICWKRSFVKEKRAWKVGETLSASIGQSYHSFTPIQIAKYTAILANGGKQISPHIIKNIITI